MTIGPRPLIALLTDFGRSDTYVGQMHAAIHGICPAARIIHLTHDVLPQNVMQGAYLLWTTTAFLPAGSIVVAVVDPGVGSARDLLAVRAGSLTVIGPDNGLLGFLRPDFPGRPTSVAGAMAAVALTNDKWFAENASHTFHGRDIMSPVAAHVANGVLLPEFGPSRVGPAECPGLWPETIRDAAGRLSVVGAVLHVDHFGNGLTNIPATMLPAGSDWVVKLDVDRITLSGPSLTFADVQPGEPLVYAGSGGFVEVAVNQGNASQQMEFGVGTPVEIEVFDA